MLIIYEENDLSTLSFIEYCQKKNYHFNALNIKDLPMDDLSILDSKDKCTWAIKDKIICIDELKGVYLRTMNFKDNFFGDYKKNDVDYVKREWWSYIVYTMSKFKNCINPVTLELISASIFETPFFLNVASNVGFNTPQYVFSPCYKELEDIFHGDEKRKYITQHSLIPNTDFRVSNAIMENNIGIVEYIKGRPIFVHVVDDNIFTCMYDKSERINMQLTNIEKEKILLFCKEIHLRTAQIILIEEDTTKKRWFVNLSQNANWNLSHRDNLNNIFDCLYNSLVSGC